MRCALGRDPAILGQVPTDRVAELGPLPHRPIARAEHQRGRLLLLGLYRHEAHARPLRRLADRLGIHRIVLMPLHKRLHIGRRNQSDLVAHRLQLACLVTCAATCLQPYCTAQLSSEDAQQLCPRDLAAEDRPPGTIRTVPLKNMPGDIQPDCGNFRHGRLPQVVIMPPSNSVAAKLAKRSRKSIAEKAGASSIGHQGLAAGVDGIRQHALCESVEIFQTDLFAATNSHGVQQDTSLDVQQACRLAL